MKTNPTKTNRFTMIATIILSIFSVSVAGVSTAAWFQINNPGMQVTEDHIVTTDDPNLKINSVNAYKSVYDEIDSTIKDYSSSHVTTYHVSGITSHDNINQGSITGFDIPSKGVGYYILGDAAFAKSYNFEETTAWTYASAFRLDDDSSGRNHAYSLRMYLEEDCEIRIREYYYNNNNKAVHTWITSALVGTSSDIAEIHDDNIKIKQGGYYNFYLNQSNQVTLDLQQANVVQNRSQQRSAQGQNRTEPPEPGDRVNLDDVTDQGYVYLDPTQGFQWDNATKHWTDDGARFAIYYWNNNGTDKREDMHYVPGSSDLLFAKIEDRTICSGFKFCRMDGSKKENNFTPGDQDGPYWNSTGNLTLSDREDNKAVVNGWGSIYNGASGVSTRRVALDHSKDGCYIVGDGVSKGGNVCSFGENGNGRTALLMSTSGLENNDIGKLSDIDFIANGEFAFLYIRDGYIYDDYFDNNKSGDYKYFHGFVGWHGEGETQDQFVTPSSEFTNCVQKGTKDTYFDSFTKVVQGKTVKAFNNPYRIKNKKAYTGDIFVNQYCCIWIYLPRTISYYYKIIDCNNNVVSDNWIEYTSVSVNYGSSYDAISSVSVPNCDWYTEDSDDVHRWYTTEEGVGSTNNYYSNGTSITENTPLYTYVKEKSFTIKVQVLYSVEGTPLTKYDNGPSATITTSASVTVTTSMLDNAVGTISEQISRYYQPYGYYTGLNGTTISSAYTERKYAYNSLNSDIIYAVYQPKGPVTVTRYASFFIKNGESCVSASTYFSGFELGHESKYHTQGYDVPADQSNIYRVLPSTSTIDSVSCGAGLYKFKFGGWYTDEGCTDGNEFTTAISNVTDTTNIYAKMYFEMSDHETLYVDATEPWSSNSTLYLKNISKHENDTSVSTDTLPEVFNQVCTFVAPKNDSNAVFIFNNGNNESYDRTEYIDTATGRTAGFNMIIISQDCQDLNERRHSWAIFYNKPNPDTSGYYLVGPSSFTGSTATEWSFESGILMKNSGTRPLGFSDGNVIAMKENVTLKPGAEFKIWRYNNETGRIKTEDYGGANLRTADIQTAGIAEANGENVKIKTGVSGKLFTIYLMNGFKNRDGTDDTKTYIVIYDNDIQGFICFDGALESYSETSFKMGYGDHTNASTPKNMAVYEQGIMITKKDVANGRAFTIRNRRAGRTTWYSYNDEDANHGCDSSTTDDLVTKDNVGQVYTTLENESSSSIYGFKFKKAGFYRFYLTYNSDPANCKVSIAPYPGEYGEGYYIVPYDTALGNTNTYEGGIKMKTITSTGATNKAVYTCYTAKNNLKFYIRCFLNGDDKYHNYSGNLAFTNDLTNTKHATIDKGVITLKAEGSYNIYITNENKVAVEYYDPADYFTLNRINKNLEDQSMIKDANTSIVLEVDFTMSGFVTAECFTDMIKVGSGSGDYLTYNYAVLQQTGVEAVTGKAIFDDANYNNSDNAYEYMRNYHYIGQSARSGPANDLKPLANNTYTYRMLILVDYDYNYLSSLPSTATSNNFYFVLRMKQTS